MAQCVRHTHQVTSHNNRHSFPFPHCPVEDSSISLDDFLKGDLPRKFLQLLGLLALSRVGIYLPLWGVDISAFQQQLSEGSLLATLDTLSGGGIGRLGLFSLGIVPYINAQIVFQLLGSLYPKLQDLQRKEGEAGRKKAQEYTKMVAVGFAVLQVRIPILSALKPTFMQVTATE